MAVAGTHPQGRGFLMGWGGAIAVLLGIGIAVALLPLMSSIVLLLVGALEALGMSAGAAVLTLYWLQAIAIGVGIFIAVAGPDERMDRLRGGVAEWSTLVREVLVITGVVSLWVFAWATWDEYVDVFNTYANAVELPMIGLLVVMIVASIVVRIVRKRRFAEPS